MLTSRQPIIPSLCALSLPRWDCIYRVSNLRERQKDPENGLAEDGQAKCRVHQGRNESGCQARREREIRRCHAELCCQGMESQRKQFRNQEVSLFPMLSDGLVALLLDRGHCGGGADFLLYVAGHKNFC
jgi:hypothetical protein